jgi:hypothetical protein
MPWVIEKAPKKKWVIEKPTTPLKSIPGKAWRNFPKDALRMGKGIVSALGSPIDTYRAMSVIPAGIINTLIPEGLPKLTDFGPGPARLAIGEEEAKAMGGALWEDYGGYENIKRTMAEKPAQSILDLLTLSTGGGALLSKAPGMAGKIGKAATIPRRIAQAIPEKTLGGLAQKLYGSALNFPKETGWPMKRAAVDLGSKLGLKGTEKGFMALKDKLKFLGDKRTEVLKSAGKAGVKTKVEKILNQIDEIKKEPFTDLEPISLEIKVDKILQQHTDYFAREGMTHYTPLQLEAVKEKMAGLVKYDPSGVKAPIPRVKAEVARGFADATRKELVERVPEAAVLTEQMRPLMALKGPLHDVAWAGRALSDRPIAMSAGARIAAPAAISAPASLAALLYSPAKRMSHGVAMRGIADSPLLKALTGPVPLTAYSTTKITPKKKKKKRK